MRIISLQYKHPKNKKTQQIMPTGNYRKTGHQKSNTYYRIHELFINDKFSSLGAQNRGAIVTNWHTVTPNIWASSAWNLPRFSFLAPRFFRWLLDYLKICAPLFQRLWKKAQVHASVSNELLSHLSLRMVAGFQRAEFFLKSRCSFST